MSYSLPNGTSTVNGNKGRTPYGLSSPLESVSSDIADQASTSGQAENGYGQNSYPPSHNEDIVHHLYHAGFQMGNYADTILHVRGRQYRLHAILLSRSPYLAHLMSTSPTNASTRNIYVPIEDEPEVTEEGFAVALGYLYSSVSLEMLRPSNARAVLAAACFLGGLHDLCGYAYESCRASISVETMDEWLRFVETIPAPPEEGGPTYVPTSVFGPYAAQLRADVFQFLVVTLPQSLQAFPTADGAAAASLNGRPTGWDSLLRVYARVPFDMFKRAVEAPELPVGSDQARFQFAKAAIALRKSGAGRGAEETVVLAFGGGTTGSGSAVHVTRKVKKRPLWKVAK